MMIAAALLAAILWPLPARGQSLAEAAAKEKERREALTAGKAIVVTNADLSRVKKKSAVALLAEPAPGAPEAASAAAGLAGSAATVAAPTRAETAAALAAARAAEIPASLLEGNPRAVLDQKKSDLESQLRTARERTGLLEIKLLGLQQQSAHAVNADARDAAAKDIEIATRTLADARLTEQKAKGELEKLLGSAAEARK